MITRIHTKRPDGQPRRRLIAMANDENLDKATRQKAASALVSAMIPGSISPAEVRMFTRKLVSDLEDAAVAHP